MLKIFYTYLIICSLGLSNICLVTNVARAQEADLFLEGIELSDLDEAIVTDTDDKAETKAEPEDSNTLKHNILTKFYNDLPWKGSLLFSDEQNERIYQAILQSYKKNKQITKNTRTLNTQETSTTDTNNTKPKPVNVKTIATAKPVVANIAPSNYSLNSILYYKPDSWSIWVNGKRIRVSQSQAGVFVEHVNEENVTLITQDASFNFNKSSFKNMLVRIQSDDFDEDILADEKEILQSQLTPNEKKALIARRQRAFLEKSYKWKYQSKDGNLFLDSKNGIFKFTLKINQTFNAKTFEILEGKKNRGSSVASSSLALIKEPSSSVSGTKEPQKEELDIEKNIDASNIDDEFLNFDF
jgi:hypothetical protein